MMQVPATVWNRIAKTQRLRTEWAENLFRMSGQEMGETLDRMAGLLVKNKKGDDLVAAAYLKLAPLLVENEAISRFIEKTGSTDLRSALPDLTDVPETLDLAQQEYRLNPKQLAQLSELLKALPM